MEPVSMSAGQLPIHAVTLFTSGVSYIERAGEVDSDAAVPLTFRTTQINDLLKSMVLLDEQGAVQPVIYGARDPLSRTLQSFAVDVTHPVSRAELLNRLRGTAVTIQTTDTAAVSGQIVGVEQRSEFHEDRQYTIETLTLLAEEGLESVKLERVRAIRLLDPRLDREFREALTALASGSDDQRRPVILRFKGTGRRTVRVGYIAEAPLWKMSYRLVLDGDQTATPYIQGWALVENTTDDDWQDVRLSLVSGRPISFIQDLYQPLYLPRPVVAPDIIASPEPQVHGTVLHEDLSDSWMAQEAAGPSAGAVRRAQKAAAAPAPAPAMAKMSAMRESVAPQAQGQNAGELFQYDITTPVTLRRQQAAMIPVVSGDIEGEKVSLYNADTDPRYPLNAVRIRNTTGLHLKGGPITLFDEGVYAGDGKMEDLPPNDSRLVSYALDLRIEGERQKSDSTRTETLISLKRGVLTITGHMRQETTYTLKSKTEKPRTVLVEHPFHPDWNLIAPTAAERTVDRYRFTVIVPAGGTESLPVVLERPFVTTVAILDAAFDTLLFYVGRTDVSEGLRETLREVVQSRRRVEELREAAAAREAEIESISADQDRVRKNMAALNKDAPLYTRYVGDLDQQETRIQELRGEVRRLRAEAQETDRLLQSYVDDLDISAK